MQTIKNTYDCHFELALALISGKWKMRILYHIFDQGVMRYSKLVKLLPNMNERMLSRQLRELENHHLIHRKIYDEAVRKVEYYLTPKGQSVLPVLQSLNQFGKNYHESLIHSEEEVNFTVKTCDDFLVHIK